MNKTTKIIIYILMFLIGVSLALVVFLKFFDKKEEEIKKFDTSTPEIVDINATTEQEFYEENPVDDTLVTFEGIRTVDDTGTVEDIDAFNNKVAAESENYLTQIFNFEKNSKIYRKQLKDKRVDKEKYNVANDYYYSAIPQMFEDESLKSSVNKINVVGITISDEYKGKYSVLVRGYADLNMSSESISEGRYYVIFEDYQLVDGNDIKHFDTFFQYTLKTDGFIYGALEDGSNTIRFNGDVIYEWDREAYNPIFEEVQKNEKEYEDSLN